MYDYYPSTRRAWLSETLEVALYGVAGTIGLITTAMDPPEKWVWLKIGGAVFIVGTIVKACRAYRRDRLADKVQARQLFSALNMMHDSLIRQAKRLGAFDEAADLLRITLYKVHHKKEKYEQITEYAGDNSRRVAGRVFSIRAGSVGVAARSHTPALFIRPVGQSDDDFRSDMVGTYGFLPKEAAELRLDRFSGYAIPLDSDDGRSVAAVVYADSTRPMLFEHPEVKAEIESAARDLAAVARLAK